MCAPLRLGCTRLCRGYAEKKLTVIHYFCDSDYTRGDSASCLEICIRQIHFSDSLPGRPSNNSRAAFTPHGSEANLTQLIL
jgi:hypothetical protein